MHPVYPRIVRDYISRRIHSRFGILVLGPRQTGKSTLLDEIVSATEARTKLIYRLNETSTYEQTIRDPSRILRAVEAAVELGSVLLFIDEVQYVPQILNDCQSILDRYADRVTVLLTGSSARKLRGAGANLLPGRLLWQDLHPLTMPELGISDGPSGRILPIAEPSGATRRYGGSLEELLTYGSLPGICDLEEGLRREILTAYTSTYLQEEIRAEALARNLGGFSRVLEYAAIDSGMVVNFSSVSRDIGVPISTIRSYFDLLYDTLILLRIPAFTRNARKRIIRSAKYVFFDTGIRNACAALYLDPSSLLKTQAGTLFEQYIILEIHRRIQYMPGCPWRISHWRTSSGVEVDLVIDKGESAIPIEIKYTDNPHPRDIRHLLTFMKEYDVPQGYLVCRCEQVEKMADGVYAVPWNMI